MGSWFSTPPQEFCPDFSCILDDNSLYLSSHHPATDKTILDHYKISHILSVTHHPSKHFPEDFTYLHLELVDSRTITFLDYFQQINEWMDNARENNGRILVHCEAGMSRSATAVMGYLLGTKDEQIKMYSLKDAYLFTKSKRNIIRPNYGFINQLQDYSENILKNDKEPLFYANYVIEVMQLDKEGVTPEILAPLLETHGENLMEALKQALEQCKK